MILVRGLTVFLYCLGLLAAPAAASASLALALDVGQLAQHADRVVVGQVVAVKTAWDSRRNIVSTIEVRVNETWKGPRTKRLSIVQVGGTLDGVVMRVEGQASFTVGERALFFLRGHEEGLSVVGLGQGKRPLRFDRTTRQWLADPGDRSAAVHRDEQGGFQPAAPDVALPLDVLRAQLRAAGKR